MNWSTRAITLAAVAFLTICMAALWLLTPPTFVSGSTFALIAAGVIATAGIAANTWRNGQATTNTSQVIHDTEVSAAPRS